MTQTQQVPGSKPVNPQENPFVSLIFNIVLPAAILSKLSAPERLGPVAGLFVALSFPLFYGLYDFVRRRRANMISALGLVSILLTGGFGLMQVDGIWFAVKEAAVPSIIAIAVIGSLWTKTPLVRTLLYNDKVIDVARIDSELAKRGYLKDFNRLLVTTTWLLAASFVLSAVLNFVLAIVILKSPSGSPAFNEELGQMTALSYPVIVIPSMLVMLLALWRLVSGVKKMTGLELEAIFKQQTRPQMEPKIESSKDSLL